MIVTRAPYRVSLLGGGTDFPEWYKDNGGAVISATIDKYCYILARYLPPFFEHKNRVVWSRIELTQNVDEINHPVVRESLRFLAMQEGIEVHHAGDLPARTGMGTSSTFTVALLHALMVLQGHDVHKDTLVDMAYVIEHDKCGSVVGQQDQAAASFGGFNRFDFGGQYCQVKSLMGCKELEESLMLFLTGFQRDASVIEQEKLNRLGQNRKGLERLYQMVSEGEQALARNDIRSFGELVSEGWVIKRAMAPGTSTEYIDFLYEKGMKAGAYGGKLLGAGGGGVLCFIVPPDKRDDVKVALQSLIHIPMKFSYGGSEVIVRNGP